MEEMKLDEYKELTKKKPKYRNQRTAVGDLVFDSKKEASRYEELVSQNERDEIKNLRLQVRYDLTVNGQNIGFYKADFVYVENGEEIVEDVKSKITRKNPVYRLKKKLMFALYGIRIRET